MGVIRPQPDRLPITGRRLVQQPLPPQRDTQANVGIGIVRLALQSESILAAGLDPILPKHIRPAQLREHFGLAGRQLERSPQRADRGIRLAQPDQARAQARLRSRRAPVETDRLLKAQTGRGEIARREIGLRRVNLRGGVGRHSRSDCGGRRLRRARLLGRIHSGQDVGQVRDAQGSCRAATASPARTAATASARRPAARRASARLACVGGWSGRSSIACRYAAMAGSSRPWPRSATPRFACASAERGCSWRRTAILGNGPGPVLPAGEHVAEVDPGFNGFGPQFEGLAQTDLGVIESAHGALDHAQHAPDVGVLRIRRQDLPVHRLGLRQITGAVVIESQGDQLVRLDHTNRAWKRSISRAGREQMLLARSSLARPALANHAVLVNAR